MYGTEPREHRATQTTHKRRILPKNLYFGPTPQTKKTHVAHAYQRNATVQCYENPTRFPSFY